MKNIKYIPLLTLLLTGCGSNFSSSQDKIGPDASAGESGQGSSTAGNAGQDSVSNAGNESGGADNAGSSGSVNGKSGSANTAGSAGTENIAGQMNAGGSNNAGSSGSNNAGTGGLSCKPKVTCATYAASKNSTVIPAASGTVPGAIACGKLTDDCGNEIQCGGCPDYYGACGSPTDSIINDANGFKYIVGGGNSGIANICGGGCVLYPNHNPNGTVDSEYYCYNSPTRLNSQNMPILDLTTLPDQDCKPYGQDTSCCKFLAQLSPAFPSHASFECESGQPIF